MKSLKEIKTATVFALVALALLLQPAASWASEEITYNLVDTGVSKHSLYGTGIEMRIKASANPPGGFSTPAFKQVLDRLCDHFAPAVIPFVKEKTGLENPEFISVRVTAGNRFFGRYVLQTYEIEDGSCGKEF
ncbi:hypothetical protein [Nitratireductor sp. XY-223]|uniref:hypothetical protein n=1 Tax=Nitratireductor sp. XY-223 TaxID=2561926 RepID=UPI0010AA029B|nr:hypothetical protein [Nitratireductor sp. XY-223]